jgi:spore coat protein U-like protein
VTAPTRRCLTVLLAGAAVLLASAAARSETCTVSAGGVAFGVYDPLAVAPLDSTGTVQVTCTSSPPPRVTYEVQLDAGQAGSFAPRAMTSGADQLTYNLYIDAARGAVWGDGTGGTAVVTADYNLTPPGSTQTDTYTVYGRAPAGQVVTAGSYLDTITVTLIF